MILLIIIFSLISCNESFTYTSRSTGSTAQSLPRNLRLTAINDEHVAKTKKGSTAALSSKKITKQEDANEREDMMMEIVERLMEQLDGKGGDSRSSLSSDQTELLDGVVRIYCTHSMPNFGMPWQRMKQDFSSSTGFVIDGNRILTNAHAVEYGSLIQVKKRSSEKKYVASVIAVGHECDLAMLSIDDPSFWEELNPLEFGPLPDLLEDVSVIGYPVGGDSISISSGVVSRIEMQEYAQASADLLAIQIDAAVNPGNSGGPVVNSMNQVIGVAFQSLSDEDIENIGYVVPVNVIDHFLDDISRHGSYSGVCGLGVRLQPMENNMLRRHFALTEEDTGVLVLSTALTAPANKLLEKGDVLLSVDSIRIANDGTIPFRDGSFKERVQLSYYFTQRFASDSVKLELLRGGKRIELTVPLWVPQRLVPRTLLQKNYINAATNTGTGTNGSIVGGVPSYLIVGGLVFLALSKEYLDTEFHTEHMQDMIGWAEEFKVMSLAGSMQTEVDEEVVMLSQVIAHSCNIGYEMNKNLQLRAFNSVPVKNLKHLRSLVEPSVNCKGKKKSISKKVKGSGIAEAASSDSDSAEAYSMVFEFSNGQIVILDGKDALDAKDQICREHFIPQYCSADLLEM